MSEDLSKEELISLIMSLKKEIGELREEINNKPSQVLSSIQLKSTPHDGYNREELLSKVDNTILPLLQRMLKEGK